MKEVRELLFELLRHGSDAVWLARAGEARTDEMDALAGRCTPQVLKELFCLAKRHDMAHFLAEVLDKLGVLDEASPECKAFLSSRQLAVYRYEQIKYECERLYDAFERAKIFYIPLKGAVIRELYPEPWLRTSCDVDILVSEADLETAISACEELEYTRQKKGYHDVSFLSPGKVHLELHFSICENYKHLDKVLKQVWDNVQPASDTGYRYALTPEFLIFHNVAHATYHFLEGGCGIRPLLDIWFLRNKTEFDEAQVLSLCEQAGIAKFYEGLIQLSEAWFSGVEHNALTREMEDYIIDGGVYGTMENKLSVKTRNRGKIGYFIALAFLPYENMKVLYPVLGKHKILLPFCWVRRWCRIAFGGMSQAGRHAIKTKVSKKDVQKASQLLSELELL